MKIDTFREQGHPPPIEQPAALPRERADAPILSTRSSASLIIASRRAGRRLAPIDRSRAGQ